MVDTTILKKNQSLLQRIINRLLTDCGGYKNTTQVTPSLLQINERIISLSEDIIN